MAATETTRSKEYIRFVVILMGLISLMDNYLAQVELGVLKYMAYDLGISVNELNFYFMIYGVIAFAVFFISWFTDAAGRKKGLMLLVLMMGIPSVLLPAVNPTGTAGIHVAAILYSLITMATLANTWQIPVAEEAPAKNRGKLGALAFLIGLIPIYAILGPVIARPETPIPLPDFADDKPGWGWGWEWAYGLWGLIFMVLCLLLLAFVFKEPERWVKAREQRQNKLMDIKKALKLMTRKDWLYALVLAGVYFIWSAAFKMGTLQFQNFYSDASISAVRTGGIDQYNSLYLIVGGLLTPVGALLSGLFLDKIGRKWTLVIGCIGSIASFIIVAITFHYVAMWGIFLCMPIVLGWITVYFAEIFPTKIRATCMGIVVTISRAAYVAGPGLASLAGVLGWPAYWVFTGLLMIIPLLSLLVKPYEAMHKTIEEIESQRDAK
ncbi:MAG: MFS transporter [Candidatus Lokiarchaeota archaeon]|nr:MFS transporter [Candidatus Lokiarchaeota archaeon]